MKEPEKNEVKDDETVVKSDEKLLNTSQAANFLGIAKADVERLRKEGKVAGVKGRWGRWFYSEDALATVITNTPTKDAEQAETSKSEEQPPSRMTLADIMRELSPGTRSTDDNNDEDASNQAPIIRMNNAILVMAIEQSASDIHIETNSRNFGVRFRIDGILHDVMRVPKHIQGPMTQRYKVMADMNVIERRKPQSGSIWIKHAGKDYNFRVSTMPNLWGENITIRIHDRHTPWIGLNKLGMAPEVQAGFEYISDLPSGLILIVGPGGSGITSTAYTLLHRLNSITQKIVSLESVQEYYLDGVTQSYYGGNQRASFPEMLRLLPLMDVDTLFLGDINTPELVAGAVEAAISGKRVIATMAASDTSMALWRLSQTDQWVETKPERAQIQSLIKSYPSYPNKLGLPLQQTLRGVLAQRLVRRICTNCKESYSVPAQTLISLGFAPDSLNEVVVLFRGIGCDSCRGSGYRGQMGIYEFLPINEEIAALIALRASLTDIKDASKASGMRELREDGLMKILNGYTTPEEVLRVLGHPKNTPQQL